MTLAAFLSLAAAVLGIIGLVGGAAFYLKYVATKSNLDGKDETIETLEKSRDSYRQHNEDLEKLTAGLQAENKVLRELATQTPEILQLTKAVTALTKEVRNSMRRAPKGSK